MHFSKSQTVSAIAAVDLADELISREMMDKATLSSISMTLDNVYKAHHKEQSVIELRVPETDLLSLWEVARSYKTRPSLGLDIGQSVNVNAKGLLANWLSCCDTLKQAFTIFHENIALLNEAECWSYKEESPRVKLNFSFKSKYTYPIMAVERSMVALVAWSEHFTSSKLDIYSAKFTFDKPAYSAKYETIFGPNIQFNADENSIELLASELNKTIQSSNPYLRELIAERSGSIPFEASPATETQTKVKSLLRADIMTYCHLDAQLRMLHMSKATLYRKLREEDTTFTELVLQERKAILSKLQKVHTHSSNEQSSEALGFKDVSSFYKFLKKVSKSTVR
jgi:AraC-like DNA-binding protein